MVGFGYKFEIILVPLPSLISGLLARPSTPLLVLEVGSGSQVPTFRNSTYLDLQVGLARDIGVRQLISDMSLLVILNKWGWIHVNDHT